MVPLYSSPSNQSNGRGQKRAHPTWQRHFSGFAVSRLTLLGTAGGVALPLQAKFYPLPGFGNKFLVISNISHPRDLSSY
jgi:hypothetical protein